MIVKEALKVLKTAKVVRLCWGGLAFPLDWEDELQMDAFGSYVVSEIAAGELTPDSYDISIAMKPVKECDE